MFSLIVNGTPCSGPPAPRRTASASSAAASADSASTTVTAFTASFTAAIRSRWASHHLDARHRAGTDQLPPARPHPCATAHRAMAQPAALHVPRVGPVDVVDGEAEVLVELHGRLVVGVDVEHPDRRGPGAARWSRPAQHERPAEPAPWKSGSTAMT